MPRPAPPNALTGPALLLQTQKVLNENTLLHKRLAAAENKVDDLQREFHASKHSSTGENLERRIVIIEEDHRKLGNTLESAVDAALDRRTLEFHGQLNSLRNGRELDKQCLDRLSAELEKRSGDLAETRDGIARLCLGQDKLEGVVSRLEHTVDGKASHEEKQSLLQEYQALQATVKHLTGSRIPLHHSAPLDNVARRAISRPDSDFELDGGGGESFGQNRDHARYYDEALVLSNAHQATSNGLSKDPSLQSNDRHTSRRPENSDYPRFLMESNKDELIRDPHDYEQDYGSSRCQGKVASSQRQEPFEPDPMLRTEDSNDDIAFGLFGETGISQAGRDQQHHDAAPVQPTTPSPAPANSLPSLRTPIRAIPSNESPQNCPRRPKRIHLKPSNKLARKNTNQFRPLLLKPHPEPQPEAPAPPKTRHGPTRKRKVVSRPSPLPARSVISSKPSLHVNPSSVSDPSSNKFNAQNPPPEPVETDREGHGTASPTSEKAVPPPPNSRKRKRPALDAEAAPACTLPVAKRQTRAATRRQQYQRHQQQQEVQCQTAVTHAQAVRITSMKQNGDCILKITGEKVKQLLAERGAGHHERIEPAVDPRAVLGSGRGKGRRKRRDLGVFRAAGVWPSPSQAQAG